MNARIYIAVPCFNRRRIVEQCLPTLAASKDVDDALAIYNDGSSEYDVEWLTQFGHIMLSRPVPIGIEAQRRQHLKDFWADKRFSHFYATDSDAIHDPAWRETALRLQEERDVLVGLYNTASHVAIKDNTIADNKRSEVIWRRVCPGISYLLTREMVGRVMPFIDKLEHHDWQIPGILGNQCAISRVSYVDHIGHGGLHHPKDGGVDDGDRCLHPTPWLVQKRAEIIASLKT